MPGILCCGGDVDEQIEQKTSANGGAYTMTKWLARARCSLHGRHVLVIRELQLLGDETINARNPQWRGVQAMEAKGESKLQVIRQ